jgi:hypothetical protein
MLLSLFGAPGGDRLVFKTIIQPRRHEDHASSRIIGIVAGSCTLTTYCSCCMSFLVRRVLVPVGMPDFALLLLLGRKQIALLNLVVIVGSRCEMPIPPASRGSVVIVRRI